MALNTGFGLLILGCGVLLARSDNGFVAIVTGPGVGGALSRRLLPFAVVLPILLGWRRAAGERRGLYPFEFGVALMVVSMITLLVILIVVTAGVLDRGQEDRRRAEESVRSPIYPRAASTPDARTEDKARIRNRRSALFSS